MPRSVLAEYGIQEEMIRIIPFGNGLINRTWKIEMPGREFILQQINSNVFRDPEAIAHNIRTVASFIRSHAPEYKFIAPVLTPDGRDMVVTRSGFYRMFPFVKDSLAMDVVDNSSQAREAAAQFGQFTKILAGLDPASLHETIPSFHDLELRYREFIASMKDGNRQRVMDCEDLVRQINMNADIVTEYTAIKSNPGFKRRVTHHDTKISNILFDQNGKSICVIDLDTLMPGHFISDVGDMMRTYLSPVSEEEADVKKIEVRDDFYKAIVDGYYAEMKDELTSTEKQYFLFAGKFMIYMQAIRFLADHFNNDKYYSVSYAGQNKTRAINQLVLLQKLVEKQDRLLSITSFIH